MAQFFKPQKKSTQLQRIEFTIDTLDHHCVGIGRHQGKAIFVEGVLPGETVKARITKDSVYDSNNKHWIYFEVLESDDRAQYQIGKQYKKQGKNFYDQVTEFTYPENYEEVAELKSYRKMAHGLVPRGY